MSRFAYIVYLVCISLSATSGLMASRTQRTLKLVRNLHSLTFDTDADDLVWLNLRKDAEVEAQREPLLASFMHATILSHSSLEKSLSFHMANQLSSPAMISTQIQALFLEAFDQSPAFRYSVRKDILAVMDRDPAVKTSPDVLLYFKGRNFLFSPFIFCLQY